MINTEKNYRIEFVDTRKEIVIYDLIDKDNQPAGCNKNKRGYAKFKKAYSGVMGMGDKSTFQDWINAMNSEHYNLKMLFRCLSLLVFIELK